MPKFPFLKKNKASLVEGLHSKIICPTHVWLRIVSVVAVCLVLGALLSSFLLWKTLDTDSLRPFSNEKNSNSKLEIDKEKLKDAIGIISSRALGSQTLEDL